MTNIIAKRLQVFGPLLRPEQPRAQAKVYAFSNGHIHVDFNLCEPGFSCGVVFDKAEARAFAANILACCDALEPAQALSSGENALTTEAEALSSVAESLSSVTDPKPEEIF